MSHSPDNSSSTGGPASDLPSPASAPVRPVVWVAILILAAAFFAAEHEVEFSRSDAFALGANVSDEMAVAATEGSLCRKAGFLAVGALGACFLLKRDGQTLKFRDLLAILGMFYFAWCLTSIVWATAPALAGRRDVVLALLFLGMLGLTRQFNARGVCLLALAVPLLWLVLGVCAELALGTFQPFATGYRFAGTLHPNTQCAYCALMCLAALGLWKDAPAWKPFLAVVFLAGVAFMWLTVSRTGLISFSVALAAYGFLRPSSRQRPAKSLGFWIVCAAGVYALALILASIDLGAVGQAFMMGPERDGESLSGRIPLWTELYRYIEQHPLLGYGYGSFWTPQNIIDLSDVSQWAVGSAHSAYVQTILHVGLIGAVVLIWAVMLGLCRAAGYYRATDNDAYRFIFAMLVFNVVAAVTEASFVDPRFGAMLAACGLAQLAFRDPEPTGGDAGDSSPSDRGASLEDDLCFPPAPFSSAEEHA
jgi:oligosaccharide repeat unit polymerase